MAEEPREKLVYHKMITPKAPTSYMWLYKPDTKFNPEGLYSVTIVLDPKNAEHQDFIKKFNDLNQKVFDEKIVRVLPKDKKAFRLKEILKMQYKADNETPTGCLTLKAHTKNAAFAVFGPGASKGQLPKEELKRIWNGSTCRIALSMTTKVDKSKKDIGLVVYFDRIQFIDIVRGSAGGATGGPCPFDDEAGSETGGSEERTPFDDPEGAPSDDTGEPTDGNF